MANCNTRDPFSDSLFFTRFFSILPLNLALMDISPLLWISIVVRFPDEMMRHTVDLYWIQEKTAQWSILSLFVEYSKPVFHHFSRDFKVTFRCFWDEKRGKSPVCDCEKGCFFSWRNDIWSKNHFSAWLQPSSTIYERWKGAISTFSNIFWHIHILCYQ